MQRTDNIIFNPATTTQRSYLRPSYTPEPVIQSVLQWRLLVLEFESDPSFVDNLQIDTTSRAKTLVSLKLRLTLVSRGAILLIQKKLNPLMRSAIFDRLDSFTFCSGHESSHETEKSNARLRR
jgi:hypothetical protein